MRNPARDEVARIERQRSRLRTSLVLGGLFVVAVLYAAPAPAATVVSVVVVISLAKAAHAYRELGREGAGEPRPKSRG